MIVSYLRRILQMFREEKAIEEELCPRHPGAVEVDGQIRPTVIWHRPEFECKCTGPPYSIMAVDHD